MTDWAKPFPVGSVYRYDLQRVGLRTNEQIDSLSDTDMLALANKMQVMYLQGDFWKHLEAALGEVLQEKENKQDEERQTELR